MIKATVLALACLAPMTASAATFQLDATAVNSLHSDFYLTFDDLDNDGFFSIDELLTFSGITVIYAGNYIADTLYAVADIGGIADGGSINWQFGEADGSSFSTAAPGNWTYSLTDVTSPIPLPASALLLFAALGGLAAVRHRKGD